MTILFIPLVSLAISQFDCYKGQNNTFYFRTTTDQCFGSDPIPAAVGLAMSILFLVIFFVMALMYHLLIHQHNPKYGGLFSMPTFDFQLAQVVLRFGVIFAMRMLIDWPFWRFVVTCGVAALLITWVVITQPYYHFSGNVLTIIQWTLFGCVRAFLELAYLIGGLIKTPNAATIQLILTIVLAVVGVGATVGLSILFYKIVAMRTASRYLLTADGLPLADPDDPSNNRLPKMKNYKLVEPAVRFLQQKQFKTFEYMNYVDMIYSNALKRHRTKADLQFHYANFLTHFRKNQVKAQSVYKTARMSNPKWPLRFLLFCQTKEQSNRGGMGNEMANAQFQIQMSKAEEMHETAKNAMRDFFSNMTAPKPKLNVIPTLLHMIVDNEAKARKIYEEMLNTHPQSTQLLRQYAALLLDIYNDEDMADIILQRADQIEEDSTVSVPSASGGTDPQAALQPMDPNAQQDEKASRVSGASGISDRRKKRKKKKKRSDAIVTELGGGGGGRSLKSLKKVICSLLVVIHLLFIIALVVVLIIYELTATTYSNDLSTLREITRLSEYTGRSSTFALMFMVHDLQFGFHYELPADDKTPSVMQENMVRQELNECAEFITRLTHEIYDLTSFIDPWITPDVDVYDFQLHMEVNTHMTLFPDVNAIQPQPMVESQTKSTTTLVEALSSLAQKTREMAFSTLIESKTPGRLTVEYPTFDRDMLFLIANPVQGIMNALKRAIFAYMDETTDSAEQLLTIYLASLLGSATVVAGALAFVYFMFTINMIRTRRSALMDLLEVPKPKLQGVIRRLISQGSDETGTGTLTMSVDESQDEKSEAQTDRDTCFDEENLFPEEKESDASQDKTREEGMIAEITNYKGLDQTSPQSPITLSDLGLPPMQSPLSSAANSVVMGNYSMTDLRSPQSPRMFSPLLQHPLLNNTPGQTTSQHGMIGITRTNSQLIPMGMGITPTNSQAYQMGITHSNSQVLPMGITHSNSQVLPMGITHSNSQVLPIGITPANSQAAGAMGIHQSLSIGLQPMGNSASTQSLLIPTSQSPQMMGNGIMSSTSLYQLPRSMTMNPGLTPLSPTPGGLVPFKPYGVGNSLSVDQQKKAQLKKKKEEEKKKKEKEEEEQKKAEEKQKREDEAARLKDEHAALLASGRNGTRRWTQISTT